MLLEILFCLVTLRCSSASPTSSADDSDVEISSAAKYIRENVWVVILAAMGAALLVLAILWLVCRKKKERYGAGYTVLDGEVSGARGFELSASSDSLGVFGKRKSSEEIESESALLNCQFYLRTTGGFVLKSPLGQIGNRAGKRWYVVTENSSQADCVMSSVGRSSQCPFSLTKASIRTVQDLLGMIHHPFILPVRHVGYAVDQDSIVTIFQLFPKGSLKDQIHGSRPSNAAHQKYQYKGKPISEPFLKRFGRQILEGLIFLRSKGFPPCLHLHSGNVFVDNKTCRISGYELSLFGFPARLFTHVRRAASNDSLDALEVALFGHLLFEMTSGLDLSTAKPDSQHYSSISSYPQVVTILRFIFDRDDGSYPTLSEVRDQDFFKNADVPEAQGLNLTPVQLTPQMKSILKAARKGKPAIGKPGKASTRLSSTSSQKSSATPSRTESISSKPPSRQTSRPSSAASKRPASTVPPPAAPPPPQPVVASAPPPPAQSKGRGALLGDIRKGTRLKKATTNDRSAPRV